MSQKIEYMDLKNLKTYDETVKRRLSKKQDKINNSNKLNSDLIDDSNATNKFVTEAQKVKLDNAYGPSYAGKDTSTNILAKSSNTGIWVGTDTNHWYYWAGTQYVDGGVYQATQLNDSDKNNLNNARIERIKNDGVVVYNVFNKDDADLETDTLYVNGTKVTGVYTGWSTTGYIPCKSGDVFSLINKASWNTWITYHDINKNMISYADNQTATSHTIPNNANIAYVRFAIHNYTTAGLSNIAIYNTDKSISKLYPYNVKLVFTGDNNLYELVDRVETLENNSDVIKYYKNVFNPNDEDFETSVIYVNGTKQTGYVGWNTTGYIPCKSGDKFSLINNARWESWNTYYDANKNVVTYENDKVSTYQEVPNNSSIAYARFTVRGWSNFQTIAIYNTDENINALVPYNVLFPYFYDIKTNDGMLSGLYDSVENLGNNVTSNWQIACGNILCIGDSLTDGLYPPNAQGVYDVGLIKENYPYYLGRYLNAEVDNYGKNGSHPSDMLTRLTNLQLDYTKYDTCIIWLGTNGGLSSDDIATSGTETYCYQQIIDMIKNANTNIKFILMKVFTTGSIWNNVPPDSVADTNTAIDLLATNNDITDVIDNSDLAYTNYPHLHNNIANTHFGKSGNMFIAQRIVKHLSDTLNDNNVEFGLTHKDSIWN